MEKINLSSINVDYLTEFEGTFASVNKCEYNGSLYAYKSFNDIEYFEKRIKKIEKINEFEIESCLLPKYFVYDDLCDNKISGYLLDYFDSHDGSIIRKLDLDKQIKLLQNLKNNLEDMHKNGIIHGDLHYGNILVDKNSLETKIIDFDNCSFDNYKIIKKHVCKYSKKYIEKYGVNEGLDIFLLNLLTFSFLNNIDNCEVRKTIASYGYYGIFSGSKYEQSVCDSLLLESNQYNNEYLIDAYLQKSKK